MKISKSTQKRVIALFVLVCLALLPDLILSVLHVAIDEDWRTTDKVTLVGMLDVRRPSYMLDEGEQTLSAPTILRAATADSPAIIAEPSQYLIYADQGNYEVDTPANDVRKVMTAISMVAVFVLSILLFAIVYQVIRGFRTGDFFTRKSVVMVRIMAVVYCVGSLIWSNFGALEASVASEFCGALCPDCMGGAYVVNSYSIVIPLVMLVIAELMNIARLLNEEESATL